MNLKTMRKFNSISLDTNIILDVPTYYILSNKKELSEEEKRMLKRSEDSVHVITMCLIDQIRLRKVGIRVVEKELQHNQMMLEIYKTLFPQSVKIAREAKQLASVYSQKTGIPPADALILATASIFKVGVFLTWNKDDIIRETVQIEIEKINKTRRVPTPLFLTPTFFMDRLMMSEDGKTLCLSPNPVPQVYRPRFFQPK